MNVKSFKNWIKEKWNNSVNWVSKNRVKSLVISLLIFLIIILIINLSWECCWPPVLGKTKTGGECEIGTLIVQLRYAIGGVIALLAVVIASDRARALDETARAQNETVKVQEQGNIEERYKNAITQFGNENSSVRLAGAYGLYHLAKDNEDRRENICDVLCVHIRGIITSKALIFNGESYSKAYKTKPSNEVQSILDLLTNKDNEKIFPFKSDWINLKNAYLNGANLIRAQLQGADLSDAQLQRASLYQAQLQGANLIGTRLQEAYLSSAQFQGADLWQAQLQGADLWHSQLQGADLYEAQLQGADLYEAGFQGANLSSAQFQATNLYKAQLQFDESAAINFSGAYADPNSSINMSPETNLKPAVVRLKNRSGKKADFKDVVFSGGVKADNLKSFKSHRTDIEGILTGMNYDHINNFKERMNRVEEILEENLGEPKNTPIPSGVITGSYPEAEADKIIAMLEEVKKRLEKQ